MSDNQPTIEGVANMEIWQNIENEPTEDLMSIFIGVRKSIALDKFRENAIVIEGTIRRELEKRFEERGDIIASSPIFSNGTCIAAKMVDDIIFDRFVAEPGLAKKLAEDAK